MPLPATRVIAKTWSDRNAAVSEAAMTSRCTITRPSTGRGTLNKTTGAVTNPGTDIGVDVPCRITATPGDDRSSTTGEQDATWRRYYLAIPAAYDLRPGDVVTITDGGDDAVLGRPLHVADVQYGSQVWQRTAIVTDTLG